MKPLRRTAPDTRRASSGTLLSPSLAVAACLMAGIQLFDRLPIHSGILLATCVVLAGISWLLDRQTGRRQALATVALCGSFICLGGSIWVLRKDSPKEIEFRRLLAESPGPVSVAGRIHNLPSVRTRKESTWPTASSGGNRVTEFLLNCHSLQVGSDLLATAGRVRVSIEGDATELLQWGDRVEFTGRAETEFLVSNPGEFDYQKFLARQGISGLMFVRHPEMVRVTNRESVWHPRTVLTVVRRNACRLIERHLPGSLQPLAEALLLGNRGHLDPEVERDFIASGTMHLLAISGLHVGILYLFLIRILNLLLLSRRNGMLFALVVCIGYSFLTDLRPSVLRATSFIALSVLGQLLNRDVRMPSLIGITTGLYLLADPAVAFDLGAWLSFLAVAALAWAGSLRSPPEDNRAVPAESLTLRERIQETAVTWRNRLGFRYLQMLAVTLFSLPLVASQFHVVSASGILVNVALIPLTAVVMVSGFLFIGCGLLLPPLAAVGGWIFSLLLGLLNWLVQAAAGVQFGSLTIPDLPAWFLPVYYCLLVLCLAAGRHRSGSFLWSGLGVLVLLVFWTVNQRPGATELICTVLSVGHGNAVVVETPDQRVLLFDAGALNRAERTAETVSRFLWTRGHRMIDTIVVSHADADHYNGVATLVDRMPVGSVITTREVAHATDPAIVQLRDKLPGHGVVITQAMDGDSIQCGEVAIRFHQAMFAETETRVEDNERSLVAVIQYAGRTLCLPGDLEKRGQLRLSEVLPAADVLVSPHHGSRTANNSQTARTFLPQTLIVSARSAECDAHLQQVFPDRTRILNTATKGAITVRVNPYAGLRLATFRD